MRVTFAVALNIERGLGGNTTGLEPHRVLGRIGQLPSMFARTVAARNIPGVLPRPSTPKWIGALKTVTVIRN